MKYFIDTADILEINKWESLVDGVTTNPSILKKSDINDFDDFYSKVKHFDKVFCQICSIEEYEKLQCKENIIVKIPLVKECYHLFKKIEHSPTCGTITYDLFQFQKACDLGAAYCIALHSKNDDIKFVEKCMDIISNFNYQTEIVGASFREARDVLELMLMGVHYVTLPPAVLEKIFTNELAERDFKKFYEV